MLPTFPFSAQLPFQQFTALHISTSHSNTQVTHTHSSEQAHIRTEDYVCQIINDTVQIRCAEIKDVHKDLEKQKEHAGDSSCWNGSLESQFLLWLELQ